MTLWKNLAVALVAVCALALAGCSSSSNGDSANGGDQTPTTPAPSGPTQEELDAETERADEAERKLAEAEAAAKEAMKEAMMEGVFAALMQEVNAINAFPADSPTSVYPLDDPAGLLAATVDDDGAVSAGETVRLADSAFNSNRESATDVLFTKFYEDRLTEPSDRLTLTAAADGAEEGAMADRFPNNGGTVAYADDDATDTDLPGEVSLPGTLMGADGDFLCTGNCSVSENDGEFEFTGTWTFDADANAMVEAPDDDYTQYGWWLFQRSDGSYRVGTFYGHVGPDGNTSDIDVAADDLGTNLGTATFEGTAIGKYAIDNRPTGTVLDAGHFEADATLTADLGAALTISGMLDNFMTGDQERDWEVALGLAGITYAAGDDFTTVGATAVVGGVAGGGAANVWTIGDVDGAADGDWHGGFYHDGDPRNDGTPASVIGEFSASHGSTAFMAGAFGAYNTAADTPSTDE